MEKRKKGQLKIQAGKNRRFLGPESSKGQLKIQEMAFMIVGLVMFFAIVGVFAITIFTNDLYSRANTLASEKTSLSITNLADTPEFNCVDSITNCVDSEKLLALVGNKEYPNIWGFSSLRVVRFQGINKSLNSMVNCTKKNYPNCEKFVLFDKNVENEIKTSTFVTLCLTEYEKTHYQKCEVAKIIAGTKQIVKT